MEQASQSSDQPHHYQRDGYTSASEAATYEEKVKTMNFDAEADSDSEPEATEWQQRKFAAAALAASGDDGRQRSRVVTHPVVRTTVALSMPSTPAVSVHPAVRTRPESPSAFSSRLTTSSWWSAQSAVARKAAAAASQRGFQQQQQQQHEVGWRPNSMDFDAELDSSESDSEWPPELTRPRYSYTEEDSRQRSRVTTRPVPRTTAIMATGYNTTAPAYHQPVRTRPAYQSPLNANLSGASQQPQPEQSGTTSPSQWSMQSAVARKAASSQKISKKLKKQQQKQQPTEQQGESHAYRPRSSSESSFGRLFFGWRRPAGYSKQEAAAAAAANEAAGAASNGSPQQQPAQYRGKNVHNFSYADAKIYSPQSQYQQQQRQKQQTKREQGATESRTKTWWTMETMGAVNSVYSNQVMLAREVPTASASFPV